MNKIFLHCFYVRKRVLCLFYSENSNYIQCSYLCSSLGSQKWEGLGKAGLTYTGPKMGPLTHKGLGLIFASYYAAELFPTFGGIFQSILQEVQIWQQVGWEC